MKVGSRLLTVGGFGDDKSRSKCATGKIPPETDLKMGTVTFVASQIAAPGVKCGGY